MKTISIIFFLLSFFSVFSQDDDEDDFNLKISLAPAALIDGIEGPNLKCGIEAQYKKIGLSTEGGIYFSRLGKGLNSRTTLKYYFSNYYDFYFGLQYFYKDCTIPAIKQIIEDSSTVTLNYKVHKIVNSLTVTFGTTNQLFNSDNIYYDLFVGIGIRHKNINQIGLTEKQNNAIDQRESHFIQSYYSIGKNYSPDFLIGIRLYFHAL